MCVSHYEINIMIYIHMKVKIIGLQVYVISSQLNFWYIKCISIVHILNRSLHSCCWFFSKYLRMGCMGYAPLWDTPAPITFRVKSHIDWSPTHSPRGMHPIPCTIPLPPTTLGTLDWVSVVFSANMRLATLPFGWPSPCCRAGLGHHPEFRPHKWRVESLQIRGTPIGLLTIMFLYVFLSVHSLKQNPRDPRRRLTNSFESSQLPIYFYIWVEV